MSARNGQKRKPEKENEEKKMKKRDDDPLQSLPTWTLKRAKD